MAVALSVRAFLVAFVIAGAASSGCLGFGGPGAHDFVSDSPYSAMLIEVFYPDGAPPRDAAVELLEQRANERLSKPGGIEVERHAYAGESKTWSARALRGLADDLPTAPSAGSRVVLTVIYVKGGSDQDDSEGRVLGVSFEKGRIALFPDNINGGGLLGSPFGAAEVERAVIVHEFGHAIGLVNHGLKMQTDHEDDEHRGHSDNTASVMYWAVENTLGLEAFAGTLPNDFDQADRADIQAAGGK